MTFGQWLRRYCFDRQKVDVVDILVLGTLSSKLQFVKKDHQLIQSRYSTKRQMDQHRCRSGSVGQLVHL
jgi:hypothetical protein